MDSIGDVVLIESTSALPSRKRFSTYGPTTDYDTSSGSRFCDGSLNFCGHQKYNFANNTSVEPSEHNPPLRHRLKPLQHYSPHIQLSSSGHTLRDASPPRKQRCVQSTIKSVHNMDIISQSFNSCGDVYDEPASMKQRCGKPDTTFIQETANTKFESLGSKDSRQKSPSMVESEIEALGHHSMAKNYPVLQQKSIIDTFMVPVSSCQVSSTRRSRFQLSAPGINKQTQCFSRCQTSSTRSPSFQRPSKYGLIRRLLNDEPCVNLQKRCLPEEQCMLSSICDVNIKAVECVEAPIGAHGIDWNDVFGTTADERVINCHGDVSGKHGDKHIPKPNTFTHANNTESANETNCENALRNDVKCLSFFDPNDCSVSSNLEPLPAHMKIRCPGCMSPCFEHWDTCDLFDWTDIKCNYDTNLTENEVDRALDLSSYNDNDSRVAIHENNKC